MDKPRVYYCDAVAGAGKTYNSVDLAAHQVELGENVIIIQPSIDLLGETEESFSRHDQVCVKKITSKNTDHVGRDIAEYCLNPEPNTVLLCTHAGFFNTKYWANAHDWIVYFDEAFEPIINLTKNFANSEDRLSLFARLFKCEECEFWDQYKLTPKNKKFVEEVAENKHGDDIYAVIQSLCQHVLSDYWNVYVEKESFERFIDKGYQDQRSRLIITAAFKPTMFSGFKQVTFLGAMVRDSFMCKWFEDTFEFIEHKRLKSLLRYERHDDLNITINYLYKRKLWSKHFYSKVVEEEEDLRVLDFVKVAIDDYFCGEPVLCHMNKDFGEQDNELISDKGNIIQLEHYAHGLNKYDHIDHYACIGAYNAPTQFTNWLKRFDGDEAFINGRTVEHAYQGLMRTSLRNPNRDKTKPNKVVVATEETALKLAEFFPNAVVQQLPGYLPWPEEIPGGRPRKWNSEKDKFKAYNLLRNLKVKVPEVDYKELGLDPGRIYLTCFKQIQRDEGETEETEIQTWDSFVKMLERMSDKEMKKDENILISPAVYRKKNGISTRFGRANIVAMSDMLIFDVDDGHLEPESWVMLFPNTQLVMYSSAGWTNEKMKYRVIIHLSRNPSIDEYAHLCQQITNKMEDNVLVKCEAEGLEPHEKNGFTGIDRSKLFPESIFYAPQTPADGKGFFYTSGVSADTPLDVDLLVEQQYDVGKDPSHLCTKPLIFTKGVSCEGRSSVEPGSIDAIRLALGKAGPLPSEAFKSEVMRVIGSAGPGRRFATTQQLYAMCKARNASLEERAWIANQWALVDPDKQRSSRLRKDLAKY
jgi:hypothetical protein